MPQLISDDLEFTIWQHELTKPDNTNGAAIWITLYKASDTLPFPKWEVQLNIYFTERCNERISGYGKTRHEAFVRLRQRLNDLRRIRVRQ